MQRALSLKILFTDPACVNGMNIALILFSCALSHLYPYELLLFSYGVLGPAHYLTQISWLHDRDYFMRARNAAPIFLVLTASLFFSKSDIFGAVILMAALGSAIALVISPRMDIAFLGVIVGGAAGWIMGHFLGLTGLFLILMLPTVLHIFVFTAAFMWVGAIKTGQRGAYAALIALFICAATFLLPDRLLMPQDLPEVTLFQPIVDKLHQVLPGTIGKRMFGFLAFAYTYHYLNWFSKAEVIRWNRISKQRLWTIVAAYVVFESVYAYNFILGYIFIMFLSLLHVLLEFPLDVRTLNTLGSTAYQRVAGKKSA